MTSSSYIWDWKNPRELSGDGKNSYAWGGVGRFILPCQSPHLCLQNFKQKSTTKVEKFLHKKIENEFEWSVCCGNRLSTIIECKQGRRYVKCWISIQSASTWNPTHCANDVCSYCDHLCLTPQLQSNCSSYIRYYLKVQLLGWPGHIRNFVFLFIIYLFSDCNRKRK